MGKRCRSGKVYLINVFLWVEILLNTECQIAAGVSCEELTAANSSCPTNTARFGNICYYFQKLPMTWLNANDECKRLRGQLATIASVQVHDFLNDTYRKSSNSNIWLGLKRCKNDWCYPDGKTRADYQEWNNGEPNNAGGNENCVEMFHNGKWNDVPCAEYNKPSICEIPAVTPKWVSISSSTSLYFFSRGTCKATSWNNANSTCRLFGGNLAVPISRKVNNEIWERAKDHGLDFPWIGLYRDPRDKVNGEFFTIYGVKPIYTNWSINEPNNSGGNEHCVHYWKVPSTWNDKQCGLPYDFICEKQGNLQAQMTTTVVIPSTSAEVTTTQTKVGLPTSMTTTVSLQTSDTQSVERESMTSAVSLATPVTTTASLRTSARASTPINPSKSAPVTTTVSLPRSVTSTVIPASATTTARPTPKPTSKEIFVLSKKRVNSTNVHNISGEIKRLTSKDTLVSEDIINTASVLEKIVNVTGFDKEVATNVLETIDNILNASSDVIGRAQDKKNSSKRILVLINNLLEKINLTENTSFQQTFDNFAVQVPTYAPSTFPGVTFSGIIDDISGPLRKENIIQNTTNNTESSPPRSTSVHLSPTTVFPNNGSENISSPQSVIFVLYKETKLFYINSSRLVNSTKRLNSYVISASIKGRRKVSNLKEPVVLNFVNLNHGEKKNASCSYWDFSQRRWSDEGCKFKDVQKDGRITCHCNHLTNFAMLMDINPYDNVESVHLEILGIVSYIGCTVSLIALVLTIITILLYRDLRSKIPIQMLLNFCISLSLTLVVFLSAAERSRTSSLASCRAAAIAMHYFILVVFMWTAVEAFNMYLLFVKIIPSYFSKFMLKCCFVAWGIPAVIVSITMGLALDQYGDTKYCRLQGTPFLVSFLAPILIIVLGNAVAFVFILHSLLTSRNGITADRKVKGYVQARRGAAIFVSLGLSWVFGVFAVKEAKLTFQYLFCIFNSLQGLLVFVFYCILQPSTRKKYRYILKKASTKTPNTAATSTPTRHGGNDYAIGTLTTTMTRRHSSSTLGSVGCHDEGHTQNTYQMAGSMEKNNSSNNPPVSMALAQEKEEIVELQQLNTE